MIGHNETAKKIRAKSNEFHDYIQSIKDQITEKQRVDNEDPELLAFEKMDKGEELDILWFRDGREENRKSLLIILCHTKLKCYKFCKSIPIIYSAGRGQVLYWRRSRLDCRNKEGQEQPWLKYNYEGFPLISSLAKLTTCKMILG